METASLQDDLRTLAVEHPAILTAVKRLEKAPATFEVRAPWVARVSKAAALAPYRALALLLKAAWELRASERDRWCPWEQAALFQVHLTDAEAGTTPHFDVLILEQCALSCHVLGQERTNELAARHHEEMAMQAAAGSTQCLDFLNDKRAWLRNELQLDDLLLVRQQLVDELESTRAQYLLICGEAIVEHVEAAHRVALLRYRRALSDPTLTPDQLNRCLQEDLAATGASDRHVLLEPELRLALRDTVQQVQGDRQTLDDLASLWSRGNVKLATEDDRRLAALLFRRLARLIHPDALQQHEDFDAIAAENWRRLMEIWHQASATHGARIRLSHEKLVNYVEHLQAWIDEATRILNCLSFHAPARLLAGKTLEERHADLRRVMRDVHRHLHAVRDDIAQLEFDPQHGEYRRVIAMSEPERQAERARLGELTRQWNDEARVLAVQLADRQETGR